MQRTTRSATDTQVALNTRSKRQLPDSTPARSYKSKRTATPTTTRAIKKHGSAETPVLPLTMLPFDAMSTILSFLTAKDLLRCMRVNRWCKQQVDAPSSLQNAIFQWSPTRRPKYRLTAPPKSGAHGKRLPISLTHLRRLHVYLPKRRHCGDKNILASCQHSVDFLWNQIHTRCHSLVEFHISSPERTDLPREMHGQLTSLQTLSITYMHIGSQEIATLGTRYPNLTSLSLGHQSEHTSIDAYCQAISQSFPQLVSLRMPHLEGDRFWNDADVAELAPLIYLRRLEMYAYGDITFTFPATLRLESLTLVKNKPINNSTPLMLHGQITSLQSLTVWVKQDSTAIANVLLESLTASGMSATLQYLTWQLPAATLEIAIHHFARMKSLKKLALPYAMNVQLLCAILRHLDCTLLHVNLPWIQDVADIELCYQTLAEAAAVQHCRTIKVPWVHGVADSAWHHLVQQLPRLQQVWLISTVCKTRDDVTAHLTAAAGRDIKVLWSAGSFMKHASITHEAFGGTLSIEP